MATIATLIVDIAANQSQLIKDVDQIGSKLDSLGGMAGKLAGAFGLAFSVDAAIGFGQALMDDADALVRMSDQTGISIDGLNRLQAAADDAGNGIDQITAAVLKMEDKVASGDLAAGNALKAIGLSIADIRTLAPDQQFIAISEGLRQIEDPAEQVRLATDLFGKTGAQVLPTLKRGFDDLKDSAVGMSEDTARALDDAGDTITRWGRTVKGVSAEALVAMGRWVQAGLNPTQLVLQDMQRTAEQAAASTKKLTDSLGGPALAAGAKAIAPSMDEIDRAIKQAEKDQRALEVAQREARRASELAEAQAKREAAARTINADALTKEIRLLKARAGGTQLTEVLPELDPARGLSKIGKLVSRPLADAIGPSFAQQIGAKLPQTIQSALQGGGSVMKSIGGLFGGQIGKSLMGDGKSGLGGMLTSKLGSMVGGTLSAALPGIGAIVGPLAGKLLGSLAGKIFSNPEKQVNPVRQAFIDAGGGLAAMNQKAAEAGVTMRAVLDAKNPKQYEAAVRDLNKAFEAHDKVLSDIDSGVSGVVASYRSAGGSIPDALKNSIQSLTTMKGLTDAQKSALSGLVADARPNFEALEQTAAGYGITLAGLGPQFAQGRLEDSAAKIFSDFTALKSAGADVGGVLLGMSDKIGKLVQDSVQFGTAIPDNMQPLIQNLIDAGKLTDASGKAIKDIGGIKFEESPVSKGFDTLAQSIDRLVSTLTNTLPRALDNLPDETNLDVNINYNENGRPSGLADPLRDVDVTPMADGGMGRVTRPTLFLAGEAGAEDFAFSGGGRSFRSGGGSASLDTSGLSAKLDQVNEQQTRLNDYMTGLFARDLARATRDEVQKVAWRKRY